MLSSRSGVVLIINRMVFWALMCTSPTLFAQSINKNNVNDSSSIWQKFTSPIADIWNDSIQQDFYLPVITWHNRYMYDDEHIHRYNERPWGAGMGISRYDDAGNWHGLYAMAFKDSFNRWEPFVGYAKEYQWRPFNEQDFRLGAGFTLGMTARDNWGYIPFPALLPLASVSYRGLAFQTTYIPGGYNNGNVFFAWFRATL
jgi:palmitoyl transferase